MHVKNKKHVDGNYIMPSINCLSGTCSYHLFMYVYVCGLEPFIYVYVFGMMYVSGTNLLVAMPELNITGGYGL
jgi:hypothetical protein